MSAEESEKVAQMVGITGISEQMAIQILTSSDWEVDQAVTNYYESLEGGDPHANEMDVDDEDDEDEEPAPKQTDPAAGSSIFTSGGGRRLGDETSAPSSSTAPPPSASTSSTRKPKSTKPKSKFAGFKELRDRDEAGDDDDDDEKDQEYYAGGDKSGLAVQEPNPNGSRPEDHVRRLLETARRNQQPPPDEEEPTSRFRGPAQTLGGDDAPSRIIPDLTANAPRPQPMAHRTLHLWDDGFSVDDGTLFRYDDPRNRRTLEMINRGSAPLDIMNVEPGQPVDVKLEEHRGEKYVQPKAKYTPFGGSGQRLGNDVPGDSSASKPAPASTTVAASSSTSAPTTMEIDDSQPVVSLQIRLGDGSRLVSRFNTTHTIGDVYEYVNRANAGSAGRAYVLATTFPTKDLTEKSQVIGDLAEFKRGGVVVQKWT